MKVQNIVPLMILFSAILSGCGSSETADEPNLNDPSLLTDNPFSMHQSALSRADNCDVYRDHLLDVLARQIADVRFSPWAYAPAVDGEINEGASSAAGKDENASAGEFTVTNIQEAGVDEPDTIKNDGKYIYAINENKIHIVQAWPPADMKEIASVSLNSPAALLLSKNRLMAFSYEYHQNADGWYGYTGTRVSIYNVDNPASPTLIRTYIMDGWYEDARLINGHAYVVLESYPFMNAFDYNDYRANIPGVPDWSEKDWQYSYNDDSEYERIERKRAYNIAKYTPVIREWLENKYKDNTIVLPKYSDGTAVHNAVECSNLYIPATPSKREGMVVIADLSGDDFEKYQSAAVADFGWTVYASAENMYLVSQSSNWYYDCYRSDTCKNYSHIHRISLKNGVQYAGSGEVDGIIDNQFNLSEYNGHLRTVSDNLAWWSRNQGSSLSVLDVNSMKKVGGIDGIAPGESIFASRFIGNKGYLVTFRQTDPLFTFDLSNPAEPKQMGELKINGYSSYIHPMDENTLLTIGREGDENGRITGLQLQMFDVSDMKNPKRTHRELISYDNNSYAYSSAEWDHHAFTYHAPSGLLAVPINIYHWSNYDSNDFSGVLVYKAAADKGFEPVGTVDHADLKRTPSDEYVWWTNLNRSRFMFGTAGDYTKDVYIYTMSNLGIKVNDVIDNVSLTAQVKY